MLILIVDDGEGERMMYSMELQDEGYDVITLPDGRDLLRVIASELPDCVILDIKMREYNGLDLLQDIRRHYYNLPVIINSAYSSFKVDLKAIAANMYVVKSSDLRELKEKIVYCLESRGDSLDEQNLLLTKINALIKLYLNDYEQGHLASSGYSHLANDFKSFSLARATKLQTIYRNSDLGESDVEKLFADAYKRCWTEKAQVQRILEENQWALRELAIYSSWSNRQRADSLLRSKFSPRLFNMLYYDTYWHLVQEAVARLQTE